MILLRFCGGSRIRTGDPMLAKHVLYQLSYTPGKGKSETTAHAVVPLLSRPARS